jgi:hypothetical protein
MPLLEEQHCDVPWLGPFPMTMISKAMDLNLMNDTIMTKMHIKMRPSKL